MKFKMNENSIFAILLRSQWWISVLVSAGLFAVGRLVLPEAFQPYVFYAALPFMCIAGYAAWRQLRVPGEAAVSASMDALRALSWKDFSAAVEEAYRREGYGVARVEAAGSDFELTKDGRLALLGCKRWKAARTGIEPLRELDAARQAREAEACFYIATGDISDTARAFAVEKSIRLVHGAELAKLLPRPRGAQKS